MDSSADLFKNPGVTFGYKKTEALFHQKTTHIAAKQNERAYTATKI
jgi:hypothetical protein